MSILLFHMSLSLFLLGAGITILSKKTCLYIRLLALTTGMGLPFLFILLICNNTTILGPDQSVTVALYSYLILWRLNQILFISLGSLLIAKSILGLWKKIR